MTGAFERIDSRRMTAVLYRSGRKIAECSIRTDSLGRTNGIAFSYDSSSSSGSYNEMLTPEAGEQSLHFKPMGMAWNGERDKQLSEEGGPSSSGRCSSSGRSPECLSAASRSDPAVAAAVRSPG